MSTWTTISDARIDADSPIDEDLMGDLRENEEYNYERALRCGTHGTGVRLAMARGSVAFADATPTADKVFSGSVTFSSDATDGDPNFSVAPYVFLQAEEDDTGAQNWNVTGFHFHEGIEGGSRTTTGFSWFVTFLGVNTGSPLEGVLYWTAIGPVSTGE